MLRVAVGVCHRGYAAAIEALLDGEPGVHHVGTRDNVADLVSLVATAGAQAVVAEPALDGGGFAGVSRALRAAGSACRVVAACGRLTPGVRAAALASGASAVVAKADGVGLLSALTQAGG